MLKKQDKKLAKKVVVKNINLKIAAMVTHVDARSIENGRRRNNCGGRV